MAGKRRSRCNALRHGLTAETIIDGLEDRQDYERFEASIKAGYRPQSATDHELVARLASLLWRLRRATAIESGLLQIQAGIIRERKAKARETIASACKLNVFYRLIPAADQATSAGASTLEEPTETPLVPKDAPDIPVSSRADIARSFLRLANLDSGIFERLGRYEASLWRQTVQTFLLLSPIEAQQP
jgi:hypothetical protein